MEVHQNSEIIMVYIHVWKSFMGTGCMQLRKLLCDIFNNAMLMELNIDPFCQIETNTHQITSVPKSQGL